MVAAAEIKDRIQWRKMVKRNQTIFFWTAAVVVSVALAGMMLLVCFGQPDI